MSSNIELVIFDCDGVLVDSEIISAQMLKRSLAGLGIEITVEYVLSNFVGRSYPTVLSEVESNFNVKLPENFGENYRQALVAEFDRTLQKIPDVDGVARNLAVPYCVATSSSPLRVARSMETTGLTTTFSQKVFTASQVKNGKPAPDLFLFAASQMGVKPENCLVVEDSKAGISAAISANMEVVRFVGGSHLLGAKQIDKITQFDKFENFFDLYPELEK